MKKIIAALILLVIMITIPVMTVSSNSSLLVDDSASVSNEIRQQINAINCPVIYIYNSLISTYADADSIAEVLDGTSLYTPHYLVYMAENNIHHWRKNHSKEYEEFIPKNTINSITLQFYLNNSIASYLESGTVINSAYVLHDKRTAHDAIIYRTNIGDYVYLYIDQLGPCLFSADAFLSYMRLISEVKFATFSDNYNFNICNLSNYKLNSSTFAPHSNTIPWVPRNLLAYICIGSNILIIAVIIISIRIYRRKLKPHVPYHENPGAKLESEFIKHHTINDYFGSSNNNS